MELGVTNYCKHKAIINLLAKQPTDVLAPDLTSAPYSIQLMEKEFKLAIAPTKTVIDALSKICRISDAVIGPPPTKLKQRIQKSSASVLRKHPPNRSVRQQLQQHQLEELTKK